ncbi:MAG: PEP-CTERM sorting domain-containing protein [Burkholderiales bacterium]|nr:PEP-CTERM sorting domain-containing protein [Burkholderiales bacterium]
MKLSAILLLAALASGATFANAAAVTVSAMAGDSFNGLDTGDQNVNPGHFTQDWTFSLPSATGELDVNASQTLSIGIGKNSIKNIDQGQVELFAGSPGHGTEVWSGGLSNGTYQISNLRQGNYYFQVSGVATGSHGGRFDVFAINPVPEPSTYALIGLGVVGLALSRRRKGGSAVVAAPVTTFA